MLKRSSRETVEVKLKKLPQEIVKNAQGGAGTILAKLFKSMLVQEKIDSSYPWNFLMDKFIKDPKNNIEQDNRSQSSARGNLQKELLKSTMSWRVFCKALRFLTIKSFVITIEATHSNGKKSAHFYNVDLSECPDLVSEEDDD